MKNNIPVPIPARTGAHSCIQNTLSGAHSCTLPSAHMGTISYISEGTRN